MNERQIAAVVEQLLERADYGAERRKQLEESAARSRRSIQRLLRQLNGEYVSEQADQAQLAGFMNLDPEEYRTKLTAQINSLLRLDEVEKITMTGHGLEILTTSLHTVVLQDGTQRLLGRFRILLRLDGGVHIRALDLDQVKDQTKAADAWFSYQHPHVYGEGHYAYPNPNVCFGNIGESVAQFLGERSFDAAGALIVQFLMRVNEDAGDNHYSFDSWKVYDPNAPEVEPEAEEVEPVFGPDGQQLGVRVRVQPRRPVDAPAQFRWVREQCAAEEAILDEDRRHATCQTCGRRVLVAPDGQLFPHGQRLRQPV